MIKRFFSIFIAFLAFAGNTFAQLKHNNPYNDYETTADTIETLIDRIDSDGNLKWPQNLQYKLAKLIKSDYLQTSQIGICVYDLDSDSLLFSVNSRQLFRPASTEKVITAVAALSQLGSSYHFDTTLYGKGIHSGNSFNGDIYIVGGFDPAFGDVELNSMVLAVQKTLGTKVKGRIIGDITMKDTLYWGEGWCWDDNMPRLVPLLYNRKDNFLPSFKSKMREKRIEFSGSFKYGTCPKDSSMILVKRCSHSIDDILTQMMKKSDNLYAEAMFYHLGKTSGKKQISYKDSQKAIEHTITLAGYNPKNYRIADGSGVSLYNYVSPELEVGILRYAYQHTDIYQHLYPSLPIAGVDGTLAKRMQSGTAFKNVRAKTGTVTGISSLAGFCTAKNGHLLALCILNQGIMKTFIGHRFQDSVCQILTE